MGRGWKPVSPEERVIGAHCGLGFVQVKAATGVTEGHVMIRRVREFAVKRDPEPLRTFGIFIDEEAEDLRVREGVLAGHGFEYLLNHFRVSKLML